MDLCNEHLATKKIFKHFRRRISSLTLLIENFYLKKYSQMEVRTVHWWKGFYGIWYHIY